ncbi:MAG: hypothetical protein HYX27_19095 [Acidobacteria bacterium]|nr:hypothetical protein [Acidobacteriota bacterium]
MIRRLLVALLALSVPAAAQYSRVVSFSGYNWMVKTSRGKVGPGPNYFSDSANNVWVDTPGRLHLKLTKTGNKWYSAEVINTASLGYGTYRFYLDSVVDNLDPNVVLGLFTWNDAPDYNHREIDIEFSRWGNAADPANAQYVVQPYDTPGNLLRFTEPPATVQSIHSFQWTPTSISHRSVKGIDPATTNPADLIAEKTFTAFLPVPGGENARMNLWLFRGSAPSNRQTVEVIISRFEWIAP